MRFPVDPRMLRCTYQMQVGVLSSTQQTPRILRRLSDLADRPFAPSVTVPSRTSIMVEFLRHPKRAGFSFALSARKYKLAA